MKLRGCDIVETNSTKQSSRAYFTKALVILLFAIALVLAIMWSNTANTVALFPTKEGIEPYHFSNHEREILTLLNDNSALLRIKAPKEARHLSVHIHTLKDDGTWDTSTTDNDMFWGEDMTSSELFEVVYALTRKDDFSIAMRCRYQTGAITCFSEIPDPEVPFDHKIATSAFLSEFETIELDQEIPIAILALNEDNELSTPTLSGYFDTSQLANCDFVQIVTMTFSDDGLT